MKKIISIMSLCAALFTGCTADDYKAPDSLCDFAVYTSVFPGTVSERNTGDYVALADLSIGASSIEWSLDSAGCYFMVDKFDEENIPLNQYIDGSKGTTSSDKKVFVLFEEPGMKGVNLHAVFPDSVAFHSEKIKIESQNVGGEWVIDTTFMFDIYAPIEPALAVYQLDDDDNETLLLQLAEADVPEESEISKRIEVEVGTRLKFVDLTTIDRPTSRNWSIPSGTPTSTGDSAAVVTYYKMGVHSGLTFTSSRTAEAVAFSATKNIPLEVTVVKSTKDFTLVEDGDATVVSEGDPYVIDSERTMVEIMLTGEVASLGASAADDFKIIAQNGDRTIPISVKSVAVKSTDATRLILTLTERLYNSDEVYIQYNSGENIISADERVLQSFQYMSGVGMTTEGLWTPPYGGFELNSNSLTGWFVNPLAVDYFSLSSLIKRSGTTSMQCVFDATEAPIPGGNYQVLSLPKDGNGVTFPEAGDYDIKLWVYVDPATTAESFTFAMFPTASWLKPKVSFTTDIKGEWFECTERFTIPSKYTNSEIKIVVGGADVQEGEYVKFYIDDVDYYPVEVRP